MDLSFPLEEAERFKGIFDQTYNKLRWWQMENQRKGQRSGFIKTPAGRRVSFRDPQDCYTDSRNYPIQAAAADLQLAAIVRVHAAIQKQGLPAYLVNFVHDELVLEVATDAAEDVSSLLVHEMKQAFLDLFKAYDPKPLSSGLVEIGKGPNYAEAK